MCNAVIKHCGRSTKLRTHLLSQRKAWYTKEVERCIGTQEELSTNNDGNAELSTTSKSLRPKRQQRCKILAYKLCPKKRPAHMVTYHVFSDLYCKI